MAEFIYADHAATTPVDPSVLEAMLPFLQNDFYNPSALYPAGRKVREAVNGARARIQSLIGAEAGSRLVFTGSGSEAANMAARSACAARTAAKQGAPGRRRILVSAAEHHAVLNCVKAIAGESAGDVPIQAELLPVDAHAALQPQTLRERIGGDVILVSVMSVNNETGAMNDTAELCRIAHEAGALFHTDAVQALGVKRIRAGESGADYISFSAHKIYGPKGVGALYAAPSAPLAALVRGGGQESGLRAGTENTAGIAGFAGAAALTDERLEADTEHLRTLKAAFLDAIAPIPDIIVNPPEDGAPHIVNISAAGIEAEGCLFHLSAAGILASMGAACNSASIEPSHVVDAIGVPAAYRRGTMRFSFGRKNTMEDIGKIAEELGKIIKRLRS